MNYVVLQYNDVSKVYKRNDKQEDTDQQSDMGRHCFLNISIPILRDSQYITNSSCEKVLITYATSEGFGKTAHP